MRGGGWSRPAPLNSGNWPSGDTRPLTFFAACVAKSVTLRDPAVGPIAWSAASVMVTASATWVARSRSLRPAGVPSGAVSCALSCRWATRRCSAR